MDDMNPRDGDFVKCGSCGGQAKVRVFDPGKIALLGPDSMEAMKRENVALKCQDCGYIVCFSCASSQTGSVGIPTCPSCKSKGGPYFFTTSQSGQEAPTLAHVNDGNYADMIEKGTKPVLLDFGAAWCGPCKALEPAIVALAKEYGDQITVSKLDVDEAPQTAQRFGIMSVPTVIFMKEGKEVHRFVGVQSRDKIASLIQTHLLGS